MSDKWIAFLDLLGTSASTGDPSGYKRRIKTFIRTIGNFSDKLGEESSISYFSDCMYLQSNSLANVVDYLSTIRDVLMSDDIYFAAAVVKGELKVQQSNGEKFGTGKCTVQGACFEGNKIAELYRQQDTLKGIGIRLDKDAKAELSKCDSWKNRIVSSFFIPNVGEDCVPYSDLSFNVCVLKSNEKDLIQNLLMKALCSNSESPRHGRFYLSLLITMMQSYRSEKIKWADGKFKIAPTLYKIILDFATREEKVHDIYGLQYLSLILLDILYHANLGDENRREIARKILDSPALKSKYSFLGDMPKGLFSRDVFERVVADYQNSVSMDILSNFD